MNIMFTHHVHLLRDTGHSSRLAGGPSAVMHWNEEIIVKAVNLYHVLILAANEGSCLSQALLKTFLKVLSAFRKR